MFGQLIILALIIATSKTASIQNKNGTLDVIKTDIGKVGSALEDFTFDILKELFPASEEVQAETRKRRSADEDLKKICQKQCAAEDREETQQIKNLKIEVQNLKEMVVLLHDQQKMMKVLNEGANGTRQVRSEEVIKPNVEELVKMKHDLSEMVKSLNQTREVIESQKRKDELLEEELKKQKIEIRKLRGVVETFLSENKTEEDGRLRSSPRASDLSSLRKLLKELPEDEEDGDLEQKFEELRKQINKKKKQQSLLTELKQLEKQLDEKPSDSDLLKQLIKAIKNTEPQSRNEDINNLQDLQDAINKLKPKEDNSQQFQSMLNKLLINNQNQRPQQINTPIPQAPLCVNNDGKSTTFRGPNRNVYPNQQIFPAPAQNYYSQGFPAPSAPEKQYTYPEAASDPNQKYQEDLRQQIDGLQGAIDGLNRPEYYQKPEDKAVIDDLERQIGDLRNIVNNLNYDSYPRTKRSLENNEILDVMTKLVDSDGSKPKGLEDIQAEIDTIRKSLDGKVNSKSRSAAPYAPPTPQLFSFAPTEKELKKSFKEDLLSTIVGKVLDKILATIPTIIERLFGFTLEEFTKSPDFQDYDVQVLVQNLGNLAILPLIGLKHLKGFAAFFNILRKNKFFKNFLLPGVVLLVTAGSIFFLVWFLQSDEEPKPYITYDNSNYQYPPPTNQYSQTTDQSSYNNPVYSRSYFNK